MINPTDREYEAEQRRHVFGNQSLPDVPDDPDEYARRPIEPQPCPICKQPPVTHLIHSEYVTDCKEHGLSVWAEDNTVMGLEATFTRHGSIAQWNEICWRYLWAVKPSKQ